jgi:hypothetical protein
MEGVNPELESSNGMNKENQKIPSRFSLFHFV